MSADELRNVFHVEHHSLVPEYQLIQLNHHISKRHILAPHISANSVSGGSKKSAHDKLSKEETVFKNANKFSDLHLKLNYRTDDRDFSEFSGVDSDMGSGSGRAMEDTLTVDEELEDGVHRIRFQAFGAPVELKLRKTEGLFKKDGLKMWTVVGNDTQPHGVEFVETEMVSVCLFCYDDDRRDEMLRRNSCASLIRAIYSPLG